MNGFDLSSKTLNTGLVVFTRFSFLPITSSPPFSSTQPSAFAQASRLAA
jgi:hypothetical protein